MAATAKASVAVANKNIYQQRYYDWNALVEDPEMRRNYNIEIQNRFNVLNVEDDTQSAESIYKSIVSAHEAAPKATISIKRKTKKQPSWEKTDVDLRTSVIKQNQVTYINKTTRKNKMSLNKA